jgi:beta-N-acetylhexosaminidase
MQRESVASSGIPLFISIDQEGGRVKRITGGVTQFPGNMAMGSAGDEELAYNAARILGIQLRRYGINMNLAPVLDVARQPDCPQWGRSFSSDPERVAVFGEAAIRGFLEGGVLPVAKHFPGLGDTAVDSHQVLPRALDPDPDRTADLLPFRRAAAAGVPAIMTAHLQVPAWGVQTATLSPVALKDWLRIRLGFAGVIITDDLEMGAVAGAAPAPEAAHQAFSAGADLLLICSRGEAAWEAAALLSRDPALLKDVAGSKRRLQRLRQQVRRRPAGLQEVEAYFQGRG